MRNPTTLALLVAGCSGMLGAPAGVDARRSLDASAPSDASAAAACHTVVPLKNFDAGKVGGAGGGPGPLLTCTDSADERIVGIALLVSDQATTFGGQSAQGIRIACATVAIAADGTPAMGPITTHDAIGNGMYGWSPSTWTGLETCAPGSVITGLHAHTGPDNDLFINVSMDCSPLGPGAAPGAPTTTPIVGSLTEPAGPSDASCPTGQVLSQLGSFTGAGLDAVELYCAKTACR